MTAETFTAADAASVALVRAEALITEQRNSKGEDIANVPAVRSRVGSTRVLLRAVEVVLRRYVGFTSPAQVTAIALWVLHTYVFEAFETTPYLAITSAAKRCGKSRLLELLNLLAARAWYVIEPTEATLFRTVEKSAPTLLMDEVDATFGKDSAVTEGLRAIYNAGYRKGATVPRCVGVGHEVRDFAVYCPKAFAGIKSLPDTVADRSIPIVLHRRAPTDRKPARFRLAKTKAELATLASALKQWGEAHVGTLAEADPELPDELSDRAQDAWEPLLAIADLAGGPWSTRARQAARELHGGVEDDDLGTQLLMHCRDAFAGVTAIAKLSTGDLLAHLVNRGDDSPWAGWWGKDLADDRPKGPASRLARMLKPFAVKPKEIWLDGQKTRGYERAAFEVAWARYCPPTVAQEAPPDTQDGRTVDRRSEAIPDDQARKPETDREQDSTVLPFSQTIKGEPTRLCPRATTLGRPPNDPCAQQRAVELCMSVFTASDGTRPTEEPSVDPMDGAR